MMKMIRRGFCAAFMVAMIFASAVTAVAEQDGGETLRIVTINIRHNKDFVDQRMPLLVDEILRLRPQVIGLQEVQITDGQLEELLSMIALRVEEEGLEPIKYYKYQRLKTDLYAVVGEGIAILSVYPLKDTQFLALGSGRTVLHARMETDLEFIPELHFFCTHLHNKGDEIRTVQSRMMMDYIAGFGPEVPSFLVGDMNSKVGSEAIEIMSETMLDAYAEIKPVDTPESLTSPSGITRPDGVKTTPLSRIDYIFYRNGSESVEIKPIDAEVCFKNNVGELFPSDHLGVVADFKAVED